MIERKPETMSAGEQSGMSGLGGTFMATWQSGEPGPQLVACAWTLAVSSHRVAVKILWKDVWRLLSP